MAKAIAKSKKEEAIKALIEVGMLIPFDEDLALYHGRSGDKDERGEWYVKPEFDNGGDATGNRNLNGISALSTAEYASAEKYARVRSKFGRTGTQEVHRIVPMHGNALIYNGDFKLEDLTPEQRGKVNFAITNFKK